MLFINITFACILAIRFYSLSISIRHEKALIAKGAIQYGKRNSTLLSIAHVVFYFAAIIEANNQNLSFNSTSQIGLAILIFAIAMLFYVIYELKEIWTVKLYILPEHHINRSFLFKYVRHPNYFLKHYSRVNWFIAFLPSKIYCIDWITHLFAYPRRAY